MKGTPHALHAGCTGTCDQEPHWRVAERPQPADQAEFEPAQSLDTRSSKRTHLDADQLALERLPEVEPVDCRHQVRAIPCGVARVQIERALVDVLCWRLPRDIAWPASRRRRPWRGRRRGSRGGRWRRPWRGSATAISVAVTIVAAAIAIAIAVVAVVATAIAIAVVAPAIAAPAPATAAALQQPATSGGSGRAWASHGDRLWVGGSAGSCTHELAIDCVNGSAH